MIIAFIFILAGIIFMIGTLIYTRKRNSLQDVSPIYKSRVEKGKKTLNSLWGIDGINNQVITINKNQHSIIVELETIEYSLLHEGEKVNVDRELISISQMLKFPIQFLEIKKQIDLGDMLEEIRINTINANENVKEYANQIISHLETFTEGLANANIAIFGVPGSGKSVTVKTIIGRTALINRRSSILDIEGEYVSQTKKLGR